MTGLRQRQREGFILLEVILALALFAIVGVGLTSAVSTLGKVVFQAREELQMTRIVDSELRRIMSLPQLEEGEGDSRDIGDSELDQVTQQERYKLEVRWYVRPLDEVLDGPLETTEGRALQQMFHVEVVAYWTDDDGQQFEKRAETWRYARLYAQ